MELVHGRGLLEHIRGAGEARRDVPRGVPAAPGPETLPTLHLADGSRTSEVRAAAPRAR